jgi:U-box domain
MIAAANGKLVEIPVSFICPITLSLMLHPLVNRAGHTFESEAILAWVKKTRQCPLTRQPMGPSDFIRDRTLELKLKAFRHQHGIPEPTCFLEHGIVSPAKLASGFVITVTEADDDDEESEDRSSSSSSSSSPPHPSFPRRPSSLLSRIAQKVRKDRQPGRQRGNQ